MYRPADRNLGDAADRRRRAAEDRREKEDLEYRDYGPL